MCPNKITQVIKSNWLIEIRAFLRSSQLIREPQVIAVYGKYKMKLFYISGYKFEGIKHLPVKYMWECKSDRELLFSLAKHYMDSIRTRSSTHHTHTYFIRWSSGNLWPETRLGLTYFMKLIRETTSMHDQSPDRMSQWPPKNTALKKWLQILWFLLKARNACMSS